MNRGFQAVVLDMDGLVLDSERTYRAAWEKAAEDLGYRLDDAFWDTVIGLQYADVERRLLSVCGETLSLSGFRELSKRHWYRYVDEHGIAVKAGLWELFDVLTGLSLDYCLATNSRLANAEECLALAGLTGRFGVVVARDHVQHAKPAPDLFLEAARRMETAASNCLAVEDSDVGIRAAALAGMMPLMVPGTLRPSEESRRLACRILNSLSDVADLIREKARQGTA